MSFSVKPGIYLKGVGGFRHCDAVLATDTGDSLEALTLTRDAMAETMETLYAGNLANYGPLKVICEQESERWFPGKTTILRQGLIVGPRDPTDRFTWPVRLAQGGEALRRGRPIRCRSRRPRPGRMGGPPS